MIPAYQNISEYIRKIAVVTNNSFGVKLAGTPVCYTGAQVIFEWHKVAELYVREDTTFI